VLQRDRLAGAEEVDVLDLEVDIVGASRAAEADAPLEGPDVAGDDVEVDLPSPVGMGRILAS